MARDLGGGSLLRNHLVTPTNKDNAIVEFVKDVLKLDGQLPEGPDEYFRKLMLCAMGTTAEADNIVSPLMLHVDAESVRLLLTKWNGWASNKETKTLSTKLTDYLRINLEAIAPEKQRLIGKAEAEHTIFVKDTYRNLKTLYHPDPIANQSQFSLSAVSSDYSSYYETATAQYIACYPQMAVRITLPHLEISHINSHHRSLRLVNIQPQTNTSETLNISTDLHVRPANGESIQHHTSKVRQFIYKLIEYFNNEPKIPSSLNLTIRAALGLCATALSQIEADHVSVISQNAEYKRMFAKKPYVRYLSLRNDEDTRVSMLMVDQLRLRPIPMNVRLEESIYPASSIILNSFNPVEDTEITKSWPEYLRCVKYQGISFECTMCNEKGDFHQMKIHLTVCHGDEPDWLCTCCWKVCSMKYLCINSWRHLCENK